MINETQCVGRGCAYCASLSGESISYPILNHTQCWELCGIGVFNISQDLDYTALSKESASMALKKAAVFLLMALLYTPNLHWSSLKDKAEAS